MRRRRAGAIVAAVLLAATATVLVLALTGGPWATAAYYREQSRGAMVTVTARHGPFEVGPYAVSYTEPDSSRVQGPDMDGFIVRMHARLVDEHGRPIPVSRVMLHHVVFANRGRFDGDRSDRSCPHHSESFYGTGEENQTMRFPTGYGYRIRKGDRWDTSWMLMNHRPRSLRAYIEYRATIDTSRDLEPVTPYWLRATGCRNRNDPIFNVPGGGRPGSTFALSSSFRMPEAGRLIAAGAHAHGGSKDLTISQPTCRDRPLMASRPLYGTPDHPYYNVLPVLHEPGPIDMSWVQTMTGIPVGRGEELRVISRYDAERPHTRAMGIVHLYVAHGRAARTTCTPLPADLENQRREEPGRSRAPRFRVPLTGVDERGRARAIIAPPGDRVRTDGDATVSVSGFRFRERNLSIPLGAKVSWQFEDDDLHNVTVADGPVGFGSQNASDGDTYSQRFDRPGTYGLFCSLHPVSMTQSIRVRTDAVSP
jgi:plastocyanin